MNRIDMAEKEPPRGVPQNEGEPDREALERFEAEFRGEMEFLFAVDDLEELDDGHMELLNDLFSAPVILDPENLGIGDQRSFEELNEEERQVVGQVIEELLQPDRSTNLGSESERIYRLGIAVDIPMLYLHEYVDEDGKATLWLLGSEEEVGEVGEVEWE